MISAPSSLPVDGVDGLRQARPMAAKKKTTTKTATAKRPAKKKAAANKSKGKRYSAAEKAEILTHVEQVNAEKGRGGITSASKKFGVTSLTISAWMRNAGITTRGGGKSQASPEVFQRLAELHQLIIQAEDTLADLNKEYVVLKRKL